MKPEPAVTAATLEFIERLRALEDIDVMEAELARFLPTLGFEHFALVSHVDLIDVPRGLVHMVNYPIDWRLMVRRKRYHEVDPVIHISSRTAQPFRWDQLPVKVSTDQQNVFAMAAHQGLNFGFTVPVHVPGTISGSASLVAREAVDESVLPLAYYTAIYAFEAARRLAMKRLVPSRAERDTGSRRLTPRQRQCLALVAKGKSDSVIAEILGLSPFTVQEHVEEVKRRYDAPSRTTAVVRALFDGELSYGEVMTAVSDSE